MPITPRALLLDFGGVIVDDLRRANWARELAETVHTLLAASDAQPPAVAEIEADLSAGLNAYGYWGDGVARSFAPTELSHEQLWADFVAADWPPAAREVVLAHASTLTYRLGEVRQEWRVRPGMVELLADAAARGILLAVVSNTIYGSVHRDFLERTGLADRFAVQVYSDEAGVRKPNPELILRTTRALSVSPHQVWFVGDTRSRDIRCGRRAGVGTTVLMRSERTLIDPATPVEPDLEVPDPVALHALLTAS
jgi:HAD superfamily hydrolase (TIGR01549 family)